MKGDESRIDRITSLQLANWRNFTVVNVDLQPRVFIVGPNASGKSNLLDALRCLHDVAAVGGGFQNAVERRGGVGQIKCMSAHRGLDISLEVALGSDVEPNLWRYILRFNEREVDGRRLPRVVDEQVFHRGKRLLDRPTEDDRLDPVRLTQTHLEQVVSNAGFREITEFLGSIRYLHLVPQQVRAARGSGDGNGDPFGGDLLRQIDRIPARSRNPRLGRIEQTLKRLVPQIQALEFWKDHYGRPHLRVRHHFWPMHEWQTEEQFSDGTLRLFGLLWALEEGGGPRLMEEPELSLHPDVVRLLPQLFAAIQARNGHQIVVSTHSPDLLRDTGVGLEEVLLLQPNPSGETGTKVSPASSFEQVRVLVDAGLPLDEAVLPETRGTAVGAPLFASSKGGAVGAGGC